MKKTTLISIIAGIFFVCITLVSCGFNQAPKNEVFEKVRQERMRDSVENKPVKVKPIQKVTESKKVAPDNKTDEWKQFKHEADKKILANTNMIREIKNVPQQKPKTLRKLKRLEERNNELIKIINEYDPIAKPNWENFKLTTNKSMAQINTDLTELVNIQ